MAFHSHDKFSGSSDQCGDVAGVINVDGNSAPQTTTAAVWVGYTFAQTIKTAEGLSAQYVVMDKFTTDGLGIPTGGNISVYDAVSDTVSSDQGALPAGVTRLNGIGLGPDFHGQYYNTGGAVYYAHLNATVPNSMKQLDQTTLAVPDAPIF